jgi:hypothetical protein
MLTKLWAKFVKVESMVQDDPETTDGVLNKNNLLRKSGKILLALVDTLDMKNENSCE